MRSPSRDFYCTSTQRTRITRLSSFFIHALLFHQNLLSQIDLIVSAENQYGKPNPSTYIRTEKQLGVESDECIAIEDSFFCLLAAKSARTKCIVLPEKDQPQWVIADHKHSSLKENIATPHRHYNPRSL